MQQARAAEKREKELRETIQASYFGGASLYIDLLKS
jgi:hypothetical protein